mgnify:CR=1 FL=1
MKNKNLSSVFFKKLYQRSKENLGLKFHPDSFLDFSPKSSSSSIVLYLRFTENNIFVLLKDHQTNQNLLSKSSGLLGFKGRGRQTTEVCYLLVSQIMEHLAKYSVKFFAVEILGRHRLRRFFLRQLLRKTKPKVRKLQPQKRVHGKKKRTRLLSIFFPGPTCLYIKENLKQPFNGCRRPKPRRK